jgi:hypothetical protein
MSDPARPQEKGSTRPPPRSPAEIREYEGKVWDLTRNLIHPAFLYVVLQVALWCALGRNPAFSGREPGFWAHTAIHGLQFLGAWGVFYGTLLRDMRLPTRTVTVVLWLAIAGTAAAWLWPDAGSLEASRGLWVLLVIELAAGFAGWVITLGTWFRAKARHAARAEGGRG